MDFRCCQSEELTFEKVLSMEWLETNGLGGYASGTVASSNTRKYHGLLVSKFDNLPNKYVLLSQVEDVLIYEGTEYHLSAGQYPNFLQKGSFDNFKEFILTTHPVWFFKFGDITLVKEILMLHEENTVLIKYKISGNNSNTKITLRPLVACRDFHKLQYENTRTQKEIGRFNGGFCCRTYIGMPLLFFQMNDEHDFLSDSCWYRNFIYPREQERGYDFKEDLYSPGVMSCNLKNDSEIIFSCSIAKKQEELAVIWQQEIARRDKNNAAFKGNPLQVQLQKVGQKFITKNILYASHSIVAGYHWFLDWGRDAMISLPGLTLYSGQENLCLDILKNFAANEDHGLIPNFLGETKSKNAYNSVDASLWFVWALQQYYLKTKNVNIVIENFWSVLKSIFEFYKNGTFYKIKMQENGLIFAGDAEINLTWMDAMVDGKAMTPRHGFQVEVNALWFNALCFILELAEIIKDPIKQELKTLVPQVEASFRETFWCEEKGYLFDFVNSEQKNSMLRPNQIFAVSLPYSPLLIKMAVSIMSITKEKLFTPYGLRTLSADDEKYIGFYGGNQRERDLAYHNGAVWPWLLGHFVEGLLKLTPDRRKVVAVVQPCLDALHAHLTEYGVGSLPELFSGDYPHQPNGCISQAWSVAEILRMTYLLNLDK